MSAADLLVLAWVGIVALQGAYRGLTAQALALVGAVGGALAGSRLAPLLVAGDASWRPLASLVGAIAGALLLVAVARSVADAVRRFLGARPSLHTLDRAGGVAGGAALALALAWVAAVVALQLPGLGLRRAVQRSEILPALVRAVPPRTVLGALDRFDPLPLLPGLAGVGLPPPDESVLGSAAARSAAESVVKVEGTACGLGSQGSGWVVRREVVATNAHVIAGQEDTRVLAPNGQAVPATPVYVDRTNDVALLRASGLRSAPLAPDRSPSFPERVAVLGYPRDGPLTASAASAGEPRVVLAPDAYRRSVRPRLVVPLRARVQRGESGAPVVDDGGRVLAMVFGATRGSPGGVAVPVRLVLRGLQSSLTPVSSGPCLG